MQLNVSDQSNGKSRSDKAFSASRNIYRKGHLKEQF